MARLLGAAVAEVLHKPASTGKMGEHQNTTDADWLRSPARRAFSLLVPAREARRPHAQLPSCQPAYTWARAAVGGRGRAGGAVPRLGRRAARLLLWVAGGRAALPEAAVPVCGAAAEVAGRGGATRAQRVPQGAQLHGQVRKHRLTRMPSLPKPSRWYECGALAVGMRGCGSSLMRATPSRRARPMPAAAGRGSCPMGWSHSRRSSTSHRQI